MYEMTLYYSTQQNKAKYLAETFNNYYINIARKSNGIKLVNVVMVNILRGNYLKKKQDSKFKSPSVTQSNIATLPKQIDRIENCVSPMNVGVIE